MSDAIGLAEALLGLDGFRVLMVKETDAEVVITVETTVDLVGCPACGTRAEAQDRIRVDIRDLPCFGRPARLVWMKRRWRCADADCAAKTWTEGVGRCLRLKSQPACWVRDLQGHHRLASREVSDRADGGRPVADVSGVA